MKTLILALLLAVLSGCGAAVPDSEAPDEADVAAAETEELEIPPEGAIPLSEIIASMEIAGHTWITEVEFEDGVWEVEFVVGDEEYELEIDPMTGEPLSDEPEKSDDD